MRYGKIIQCFFLGIAVSLSACMPYEEEVLTDVRVDLKDSLVQRIYTFQHQQQGDSLISYFRHRNPTYRYLSAVAFGSLKAPEYVDTLAYLLRDPVDEVRAGAAFALGQIGTPEAEPFLINAFDQYDTVGHYRKANRAILEAIGKCGSEEQLEMLSTVSTYEKEDTALLEGQAWGIYRYALRNLTSSAGTDRMIELVTEQDYPSRVRFIAANYLYRASGIGLDSTKAPVLARTLLSEEDPNLRMTLAIGLGKTGDPVALEALLNLYKLEQDYRVKCNILRALNNFEYDQVKETVLEALHDPNPHISSRAAQFFLEQGIPEDATTYWRLTRDSIPWQSQITLFGAALRHLPNYFSDYRGALNSQLRKRFQEAASPFEKAAALQALTEWPWNLRYIYRNGFQAETPFVRGAAVQAIAKISANAQNVASMNTPSITKELAYYGQEAINTGEPDMMIPAAEMLMQPKRNFRAVLDSLTFLNRAIAETEKVQHLYAHHVLMQAKDFLNGKAETPVADLPLKPIDWKLLTSYSIEPMALVKTTKGVIQLRLLPKIAPASVANFIQLAQSRFYRDKYFYRVVPNFVIQGAESLDYDPQNFTIRSELPPVHFDTEGLLGMASSGNHTESTQFFITHSPTPHLDGNYTLFGRVIAGMDVVHQIQEGDQVQEIIIK